MISRINGRTQLAGVIGNPLDHTLSPAMHNAVYKELDLDWVYLPLLIANETDLMRFLGAARILPFVGFNITMPFKHAMLSMCDEVAMLAKMAGAVNTVHVVDNRFIGYNTDGRGLIESLAEDVGFQPDDKDIVIVGAGGAARAAFVSFVLAHAGRVTVVNRTFDKAEELVDCMTVHACKTEVGAVELTQARDTIMSADLVVNATSVGMSAGDSSLIPSDWFRSGQVVYDMIYRPEPTAFVSAAREMGATTVNGLGMLVAQGAIAVDIWNDSTQIRTPHDVMRVAAERVLSEQTKAGF